MSGQILAPLSINAARLKLRGWKLPGYLEGIDDIGQPGGNQAPKYRPSGESADEVQRYCRCHRAGQTPARTARDRLWTRAPNPSASPEARRRPGEKRCSRVVRGWLSLSIVKSNRKSRLPLDSIGDAASSPRPVARSRAGRASPSKLAKTFAEAFPLTTSIFSIVAAAFPVFVITSS